MTLSHVYESSIYLNIRIYLDKNGVDANVLKQKVNHLLNLFCSSLLSPVCNIKLKNNTFFQLFGIDILIDQNLEPFVLEINKGPDMKPKDQRDKKFKTKILTDVFSKLGLIKTNEKNLFKHITTK